jgi:hypothetical protein
MKSGEVPLCEAPRRYNIFRYEKENRIKVI